jgi:hypothetical protein
MVARFLGRKLLACGFVLHAAWACGGSDERRKVDTDAGAGRDAATGGSGNTSGTGGTGGTGALGGSGGGPLVCGTATCAPETPVPGVTLAACCPSTPDRCGLDVSSAASVLGLPAGCVEVGQPGADDATCTSIPRPSAAGAGHFTGCCRSGACGVRIDIGTADFGCVDVSALLDAGAPRACGQDAGLDAGSDAPDAADAGVPPMCTSAAPCSWRKATPASSPPVLAWAAAAYDPDRDRTILFGGAPTINGGTTTAETWAWDGTTWTQLAPAVKPQARWTHGMVWDPQRRRIVLFGGLATDQAGSGLADTWEWDGTTWAEVRTAHAPSPRGIHGAIAYDASRRKVVIRGGGTLPGQTLFADTWTYDGSDWVEIQGTGPSGRVAPALAFDEARRQLVLFGGGTWSPYYGDTWSFDGATWRELTPARAPSIRQSARMIHDSGASRLLLFGGYDGTLLNDLWQWDGSSWSEVVVEPPPPRCCYSFAHDTRRGEAVLFGGPDNETWIYGD